MATPTAELSVQTTQPSIVEADSISPSDRELLQRFAAERDEADFGMLVQRHQPILLRVCQRVLQNRQDAEDVCQAAFLVLARKAASTSWRWSVRSVGKYLYSIAYRLAQEARTADQRRRYHESQTASQRATDLQLTASLCEAEAALDEELAQLPEKLRIPLVLFYLQGRTRAEAAQTLGYSARTLDRRLIEALERMRTRLTRRGIALSPMLLLFVLEKGVANLNSTALWIASTVQAAVKFAARRSVQETTPQAAILAESVVRTMVLTQAKIAAAFMATLIGLAAGGILAHRMLGKKTVPSPLQTEKQGKKLAKGSQTVVGQTPPRADLYGDPLPDGALARLGTVRFRHGHHGMASLSFTPDGKSLLVASDGYCQLLDAASGKPLRRFEGQAPCRLDHYVQLSPNGSLLMGGISDRSHAYICIWETATGNHTATNLPSRENLGKHDAPIPSRSPRRHSSLPVATSNKTRESDMPRSPLALPPPLIFDLLQTRSVLASGEIAMPPSRTW